MASKNHNKSKVKKEISKGSVLLYLGTFLLSAGIIALAAISGGSSEYPSWAKTTGAPIEIGSSEAPKVIDIYEDFQCPGCGQFERLSGEVINKAIEDKSARVRYHLMSFLGPESVRAANASACAVDEGNFTDFHTILFQTQPSKGSGGYSIDSLIDIGQALGFSAKFESCVRDSKYRSWVTDVNNLANSDGIESTPTVKIDGELIPISSLEPESLKGLISK